MRENGDQGGRAPRLVGIEGLRAVAATTILVYHVWLYAAPDAHNVDLGILTKGFDNLRGGVTLFFTLSGFLLFRPYVAAALRGRPMPSMGAYFRNRALRILPAYWVILLVVLVLIERELLRTPGHVAANVLFLQNYFEGTVHTGIVPAWSLAIEVVFYLAVPVLGLIAYRAVTRSDRASALAAALPVLLMFSVGIASKVAIRGFDLDRVWQLSFLAHADWFAAGMAVAILRVRWEDGRLTLPRHWRPAALAGALALTLAAMASYYAGVLTYLEYQTPIAIACGLVLALVVFSDARSALVRFLDWRPVAAAGLASYSVFLWHDPLVRGFREAGLTLGGAGGMAVNLAFVAAVTAVLSTLTYLYVEKPALARKRAWEQGREAERARVREHAGAPATAPLR